MASKLQWEPYNYGSCDDFTCYDLNGKPYSGTQDDFEALHITMFGLRNNETGEVIVINCRGCVAATGIKIDG